MSKNIVNIMFSLARNPMLAKVLAHDVQNPYDPNLPIPKVKDLIKPDASTAKIFPYPFDPDATKLDGSFIRVYYNDGTFSPNEVISESQIHIDIVVSKTLWLIDNGSDSLIRPYDIAGRVVDLVGRRSLNTTVKINFTGYQHLYINTKYDCIRLYAEYMSVESG